ncbi:MAG: PIN domain-containing protein [Verrucomicrobiota bacterium]
MIHLDANVLISLSQVDPAARARVEIWLKSGERLCVSAPGWQEFVTGPVTPSEIADTESLLLGGVVPYGKVQAEKAAEFFNLTGRRRALKFDCMIAAAAVTADAWLATSNQADFAIFVPLGLKLETV